MSGPIFTSVAVIRGHILKRTHGLEGFDEEFECDGEKAGSIVLAGDGIIGMAIRIGLTAVDNTVPPLIKKGRKIFRRMCIDLQNITQDEYTEYLKLFEHDYDQEDAN